MSLRSVAAKLDKFVIFRSKLWLPALIWLAACGDLEPTPTPAPTATLPVLTRPATIPALTLEAVTPAPVFTPVPPNAIPAPPTFPATAGVDSSPIGVPAFGDALEIPLETTFIDQVRQQIPDGSGLVLKFFASTEKPGALAIKYRNGLVAVGYRELVPVEAGLNNGLALFSGKDGDLLLNFTALNGGPPDPARFQLPGLGEEGQKKLLQLAAGKQSLVTVIAGRDLQKIVHNSATGTALRTVPAAPLPPVTYGPAVKTTGLPGVSVYPGATELKLSQAGQKALSMVSGDQQVGKAVYHSFATKDEARKVADFYAKAWAAQGYAPVGAPEAGSGAPEKLRWTFDKAGLRLVGVAVAPRGEPGLRGLLTGLPELAGKAGPHDTLVVIISGEKS